MQPEGDTTRIPIIEEQVVVDKVVTTTDRTRVSTTVDAREVVVEDTLRRGASPSSGRPLIAKLPKHRRLASKAISW